ncbi:MAG: fumarylacetoacetate hydrolase family protein [Casimicrobiaceae bacterium]|nr:fumarylacetoacetate hydrolase family protein [Casimicrobiaceae bacterium]MCX8098525.1 fumarylacetoacetate hydrolase family protein [Casimicrobiaceae bacterium]MDW8312118.1 fumarylacetoacetate hydrolase family protein [Burkholderiales bacterium]
MRLIRFGPRGRERPGLIAPDGTRRSLEGILDDWCGATLDPRTLARIRRLDFSRLPRVSDRARLGPPIARPSKFIAIGLNYADHAEEAGLPIPAEPVVFSKWTSCLSGPNDPIVLPPGSVKTDWEVELGVVIGRRARHVPAETALNYVAGYCLVNDVSERQWQMERGPTWDKGKGFDTFGPVGPWLLTRDEVPDPQQLDLWLDLNGVPMQRGHTSRMIFTVAQLISYCSQFVTLEPGDLITTGTPPGVGMAKKPEPRFLRPGDRLRLGAEGLGEQATVVVGS